MRKDLIDLCVFFLRTSFKSLLCRQISLHESGKKSGVKVNFIFTFTKKVFQYICFFYFETKVLKQKLFQNIHFFYFETESFATESMKQKVLQNLFYFSLSLYFFIRN